MFNIGVETGQVLFVLVVSVLLAGLHRLHGITALTLERATPYAIGGIAAIWTIDRVTTFL
jgi:fumarate reductase subunit D